MGFLFWKIGKTCFVTIFFILSNNRHWSNTKKLFYIHV